LVAARKTVLMGTGALLVRGGRLRERITIQRRSNSRNEYGEENLWTDIATVWAGVEPLSGREFFTALQAQADVTTRIVCRYASEIASVTPKDRIKHGAVYFDIRSVIDPQNRHRELQFMCTQHLD
jgi:SPP1 family predicted phage head-tail adaptor